MEQESWEMVICHFLPLNHSLFIYTKHTLAAVTVASAGMMSFWHSQRRLGPIWWCPLNKSWFWLRMNCSAISQAACNRVLDLFPPLAGIWRFATQTREWAEVFALIHHSKSIGFGGVSVEFSPRMSSLLPFMFSLCLEACFLLRCYHCTFHIDILSVRACAAWFLSLLKFQSRIRAVCVFSAEWVIRFCSSGVCRHDSHIISMLTTCQAKLWCTS